MAWGIPIAFSGSFILLPLLGVTINVVVLLAFIITLGIVVDDAIITGENVFQHMQRGSKPLTAAIKGTQEVATPVFFGIITTMVASTRSPSCRDDLELSFPISHWWFFRSSSSH